MKELYVAGGDGFNLEGRMYHEKLVEGLESRGYEFISPWVSGGETAKDIREEASDADYSERRQLMETHNEEVFRDNTEMIDEADAVLANLNRPDVDSGTAWEIGYAYSSETPVVGYRTDFRSSGDNEACSVNLMIDQTCEEVLKPEDYGGLKDVRELQEEFRELLETIDDVLEEV